MKKWYFWLLLSLCFAVGGVINFFDGRSIIGSIVQVSITVVLAFVQLICDKKGEKGKKAFNFICITAIVILIVWVLCLIYRTFA